MPYLSSLHITVALAGTALDKAEDIDIIARNASMTAIMVFVIRDQTS